MVGVSPAENVAVTLNSRATTALPGVIVVTIVIPILVDIFWRNLFFVIQFFLSK